jgi:hypothetical protein
LRVGIQNLLTELKEELLKTFGHVNRMNRTILRRALELKLKGKRPMG